MMFSKLPMSHMFTGMLFQHPPIYVVLPTAEQHTHITQVPSSSSMYKIEKLQLTTTNFFKIHNTLTQYNMTRKTAAWIVNFKSQMLVHKELQWIPQLYTPPLNIIYNARI